MVKSCSHCKKLQKLYPDKKYTPHTHNISLCQKLKETICLNCKQIGHTPKYCKVPKKICVLCQQIGHDELRCGYKSQIITCTIKDIPEPMNLPVDRIDWMTLYSKKNSIN
jgi:hypothetical protein